MGASAALTANRNARTRLNNRLLEKGVPAKACSKCFVVKGQTSFSKGRPECRPCRKAASSRYYAEHRDQVLKAQARYYADNADRKLAYQAKYYANNRVKVLDRAAQYRAENADIVRERKTRYYADPSNRAAKRASAAEYRKANADRIRESLNNYCAANKLRNADRVQDPNVLKRCGGRCGEVLPETSFSIRRRSRDGLNFRCRDCDNGAYRRTCREAWGTPEDNICHLCGLGGMTDESAHADHLVPQSKGGSDEQDNLRWAHARCNVVRNNRPLTREQLTRLS